MEAASGYSGKFVVRLPPPLHQRLAEEARRQGCSLNKVCVERLSGFEPKEGRRDYAPLLQTVRGRFGPHLLSVLVFGSQVTGEATAASDVDFLIVLSENTPLVRPLYDWWDTEVVATPGEEWNPQFVHLPSSPQGGSGLWFEVALSHKVLWEKGRKVSRFLEQLKKMIADDEIRRYWSNGQPYWVWTGPRKEEG